MGPSVVKSSLKIGVGVTAKNSGRNGRPKVGREIFTPGPPTFFASRFSALIVQNGAVGSVLCPLYPRCLSQYTLYSHGCRCSAQAHLESTPTETEFFERSTFSLFAGPLSWFLLLSNTPCLRFTTGNTKAHDRASYVTKQAQLRPFGVEHLTDKEFRLFHPQRRESAPNPRRITCVTSTLSSQALRHPLMKVCWTTIRFGDFGLVFLESGSPLSSHLPIS